MIDDGAFQIFQPRSAIFYAYIYNTILFIYNCDIRLVSKL